MSDRNKGHVKNEIIWMPHPGHFIASDHCQFRLSTYVNGYIVSTVGELKIPGLADRFQSFGISSPPNLYETMVFKAIPASDSQPCCPYVQDSGSELECQRYTKPEAATKGHMEMIEKYAAVQWGDA